MAIKQAKIFTVTSVKGGTGKTTTVLNLAGIFENLHKKVLILDLDLYAGGIAMSLALKEEKDIFKFVEDLRNNRFTNVSDYVNKYDEYIDVISSPKDPRLANKIGIKYLTVILSKLKPRYDVILIDTNHSLDDINLMAMDYSDDILYIMNNDSIDIKNMRTMISIYTDMEKDNYKIILNNSNRKGKDYYTEYDLKHMIHGNIDYIIPESFYIKSIDKFILSGKILTLDSKIRRANKKGIKSLETLVKGLLRDKNNKEEISE